jgi:glycerophosphoryl diester phosphodiesterase
MFNSIGINWLLTILLVFATPWTLTITQPPPSIPTGTTAYLENSHAHNDYLHPRPLLDALQLGFRSIEADVWLVQDRILVAHDRKDLSPERNFEEMYLKPLLKRFNDNNGWIYSPNQTVILLIDIKSNGDEMYPKLKQLFEQYKPILKPQLPQRQPAVQAILSGNRPIKLVQQDTESLAFIDGRLETLEFRDLNSRLIPLISDNWRNHFRWNGEGEFPQHEREKLNAIVKKTHDHGCLLRFWATPENERLWRVLRDSGVDLIGTDDLDKLASFLQQSK